MIVGHENAPDVVKIKSHGSEKSSNAPHTNTGINQYSIRSISDKITIPATAAR
jgi:hypothetical protein